MFRDFYSHSTIELNVSLKREFENVYDLGYALVDLQALITGFTRICEDDEFEEIKTEKVTYADLFDERNQRITNIELLLNKELPTIDEIKIHDLSRHIEAQYGGSIRPVADKSESVRAYPTTSRRFNAQYKDLLVIKEFRQGSLILDIVASVAAGLVLKFLDKYFSRDENTFNINVTNNIMIIGDSSTPTRRLKIMDSVYDNDTYRIHEQDVHVQSIDDFYNEILDSVEVDYYDVEKSVLNLLERLSEEKILSKNVIYDKRGIKTFANDIERFVGNHFDVRL